MSAVQSRPCPPLVRAGNFQNWRVTRPSCLRSLDPVCPARAWFGTKPVQQHGPLFASQTVLEGATRDDLGGGGSKGLAAAKTASETTLETASRTISASEKGIPTGSTPRLPQTPYRRLPRFTRAKASHRPPIALQGRDLELLRTVYEYRLLSTPQLLKLFENESRDWIYRRLQRLFHHGYLNRIGRNPNALWSIHLLAKRRTYSKLRLVRSLGMPTFGTS